ncbi:MAG: hypothetical protein FWC34_03860 [Bacteroidetes bacterium]|nr:hypothetical protein [Bacteroidota bacterium]MCL2303398.1 hypothetical protein [Lentimicrobiaceae bacterium]
MAPNKNLSGIQEANPKSEVNEAMEQNLSKKTDFQKPQKTAKKKFTVAMRWTNVSLVLSVIMFAIAGYHTYHMIIHTRKLEDLANNAETRFVRTFPDFIPQITGLVKEADKKIIIFKDQTSFGLFSSPKEYQDYIHALLRKAQDGKKIIITAYDEGLRFKCRAQQFGVSDTISEEIQDKQFKEHLLKEKKIKKAYEHFITFSFGEEGETKYGALANDFKKLNEIRDRIMFGGSEDLKKQKTIVPFKVFNLAMDSMAYYLEMILCRYDCNVSIYESSKYHNMHYWLKDDKVVIFAFPRHKSAEEVAFRTTNGNFLEHIGALNEIDMKEDNPDIKKKIFPKN